MGGCSGAAPSGSRTEQPAETARPLPCRNNTARGVATIRIRPLAWAFRLCVSPVCFAWAFYPGVLPWCSAVSPSLDQAPLSFCLALLGEGAPPSHRRGRKITYCPVCSNCTIGIQIYKRVLALPSANTFPSHRTTALQHRYTSRICVLYCIFFLVFPAQLSVFCLARPPRQKGLEFRTAHTGDRKKGRREGEKKQRLFITSTN